MKSFRLFVLFLLLISCSNDKNKRQDEPSKKKSIMDDNSSIPTLEEVKGNSYESEKYLLTHSQAVKAGIVRPIVTTGRQYVYIIHDVKQYSERISEDGKSIIEYGYLIRAILKIRNYDTNAKIDFFTAALNIQNKHLENYFSIKTVGINNPKVNTIVSDISNVELNIQNLQKYIEVTSEIISIFNSNETKLAVKKLGERSIDGTEMLFKEAPIINRILEEIVDGENYREIKKNIINELGNDIEIGTNLLNTIFINLQIDMEKEELSKIDRFKAEVFISNYSKTDIL